MVLLVGLVRCELEIEECGTVHRPDRCVRFDFGVCSTSTSPVEWVTSTIQRREDKLDFSHPSRAGRKPRLRGNNRNRDFNAGRDSSVRREIAATSADFRASARDVTNGTQQAV